MVEGINNRTGTPGHTKISCYTCSVQARPKEIVRAVGRDVTFAWSGPDGPATLGYGSVAVLRADQRPLSAIRREGKELLDRVDMTSGSSDPVPERAFPRFFGGVAFSPDRSSSHWEAFGRVQFVLPELQFTVCGSTTWLTLLGGADEEEGLRDEARRIRAEIEGFDGERPAHSEARELNRVGQQPADREEWEDMVRSALSHIDRNELQKVVLAQRRELAFDAPFDLDLLQEWLFDASDNSYRYLFRPRGQRAFVGRSPECILQKQGKEVRSESVGGTIETGENRSQQEQLAEELVGNQKDQREHSLVVKSIRDHLEPIAHSVKQEDQTVRVLSNVQHLCTPIHAQLMDDQHVLDLVEALHPTSAVGGYPRDRAMDLIHQLEPFDRGWYGGPIGWFDGDGDGCFAVGIRSGLMSERCVYLYAGAGIVEGSEPDREWEEVQWKFESMTSLITRRLSLARSH